MSQLEIIHLRTSGKSLSTLGQRIRESLGTTGDGSDLVTVYSRVGLETDVAIHICHQMAPGGKGPTSLGLRLASELRAHGLVDHALWEELT